MPSLQTAIQNLPCEGLLLGIGFGGKGALLMGGCRDGTWPRNPMQLGAHALQDADDRQVGRMQAVPCACPEDAVYPSQPMLVTRPLPPAPFPLLPAHLCRTLLSAAWPGSSTPAPWAHPCRARCRHCGGLPALQPPHHAQPSPQGRTPSKASKEGGRASHSA